MSTLTGEVTVAFRENETSSVNCSQYLLNFVEILVSSLGGKTFGYINDLPVRLSF
jgi:hypothetical protein